MCIDICPVGALTSGAYRYKTRPWEMEHVGTICTHCSNGCKTTLGVRNDEIIRGNNRDRSGINGEFLCIKGRYAFDFSDHPERLQSPHDAGERQAGAGVLVEGARDGRRKISARSRRAAASSASSVRTTPPTKRIIYLQKFAREVLGTNNIDHHRTGDVVTLLDALSGSTGALATTRDLYEKQGRPGHRRRSRARAAVPRPSRFAPTTGITRRTFTWSPRSDVREDDYAAASLRAEPRNRTRRAIESLRDELAAEPELVILFGDADQGRRRPQAGGVRRSRSDIPVQYCRWSIIRIRAARSTWGWCRSCCRATSLWRCRA